MNIMQNKISVPSLKRWISDIGLILMRLRIILCMVILIPAIGSNNLFAQGVGISEIAITPEPSSILELKSTVRGFLAPRMTTSQRMTLGGTSPAAGLLVYDTDTKSFWYWDAGWKAFASGAWGTSNQLLGMNAAGNANEYKTLVGIANQIYITHAQGQITLSTPQDIHTGAAPTFQGLTISGLAPNAGVYTDGSSALTSTPPQSGVIGYWSRTDNILSPVTAGDHITTAGNIYTTGTGAITSSGLLTGNSGATISGGPVSLNNNSNFPVNIGTGNSTGAVTIGNSSNTITLPAFSQAGVVHNSATGLLSTGLIVNDDITNGTIILTTKVNGILPIANGGTNSGTPLQNHRVMVSRNGQIVEAGHLANGMIIVGKDDDEPQLVTMNGDITINNTGITAIGSGRVLTNMISDEAVTSVKIVDGGVATDDLADNSVTSVKIVDGAVVTADLADNSVTSAKIVDETVSTADLADNAITTVKITNANVTPAKISPGANNQVLVTDGTGVVVWMDKAAFGAIADQVTIEGDGTTANPFRVKDLGITTAKLADGAVTTIKLSDGTVTTLKLADGSVTTPKLASDAVLTGNILNETILSADIKDGEIATVDLADNAVTSEKIIDGEVATADLMNNAITYAKIQDLSTTGMLLGSSSTTTPVQEIALGSGLSLTGTTLTASGLGGTVTSVSVSTGNGLAGTVTNPTTIPAITLSTTVSGMLKGDGTAISAATAGTDYVYPNAEITGDTKTKITYDAMGLVTAGTDATGADIVNVPAGNITALTVQGALNELDAEKVVANGAIISGTNTKISYDTKGLVTGGTSAILASADYVNQGTVSSVLHGNASGNPSWGQIFNSDVDVSAGIEATKLSSGVVDNDEFNYLNGVTSGIQAQIDSKADIAGQVFSGGISATNLSGTNTGDVTLAGQNYLSLSGQVITAGALDLSGTNATGTLAAGRFPALTGDVTTSAGSLATTISANAVTYNKIQNLSTTGRLLGSSSLAGTTLSASGLGGTVTSVGLSLPLFIEVTNSPVTGSGVLTGTLANQTGNAVFASPDGASGAPTFRSLLSNDIPNLDWAKITTGKPTILAGYGITDAALSTHNHTVDGLSNVNVSGKANNDILQWDGTSWVNKSLSGAGLITTETDPVVKAINGIVKSDGSTISSAIGGTDYLVPNAAITGGTNTKISYDSKGLVTGGASAILASADYVNQGTVSSVLHGNASGNPSWGQIVNSDVDASAGIDATKLVTGVVDNSEFNALDGVTTGIQTQISSKANISGQIFTGAISATNLSGTNTGDVSLGTGSENYLSLTGQVLSASAVNLSGTNVTGILAAGRFPALTGDVTTSAGSVATTLSNNSVTYGKLQNVSTTGRLLGSSSTTTPVQEITLGSGLSMSGTTLTATGTGGTVTSVGLSLPSFITVSGSPVTAAGDLTGTLTSQTSNTVFAAPDGSDGAPVFRTLTIVDIPNLPWSKITTGKPTTLAGYGITDAMSTSHVANGITSTNISNWTTAYSWGNHASAGYLTSFTETDPVVKAINGIVKSNGTAILSAVGGTDYVVPNTAITSGTNTKISYDSKGLVTGSSAAVLASADYSGQGAAGTVLHGGGSGNPSWGQIVNADIDAAAGIVDTKLATLSTSGKVANSATTATSLNTAGTIVLRDGSGNFAAGTITANLTGNASSATNSTNAVNATNAGTATNLAGGLGGSIPYQSSANTTAMLANGTAGQVLTSNGGTAAPSWSTYSGWNITGNSGTNPGTNFVGTRDNNDLVFRTNNNIRASIDNDSALIELGNSTSTYGVIKARQELVLRQNGDTYGSSVLRLRNRNDENGAIFETTNPTITLIDFIFKTASNQRNIRYESRPAMARTGNPSFHIGGTDGIGADPDNPVLSIGDYYSAFSKPLRIGNYSSPTALLHLAAGTSTAGTAPIKFTAGTNLSSPEDGAVEYDGNLYVTSSGTRFTLARTLTNTQTLDFPPTALRTSSDLTITIDGASSGDVVLLGVPAGSVELDSNYTAWVSAANTITVRFNNYSNGAINPASGTFRVSIMKY